MKEEMEVTPKNVYGVMKYYPANDFANFICEIAGTKIVTDSMIAICKRYDIEINVVHPVINL